MPTIKYPQEEFLSKYKKIIELAMKNAPQICSGLAPNIVSVNADKMSAVMWFETSDWMANLQRNLHGGIITSIFDNGMGSLAILHNNLYATPTISLNTNFMRAIPIGAKVYLEASIVKLGNNVIFTDGKIWLEGVEDKICATCSGSFFVTENHIVMD